MSPENSKNVSLGRGKLEANCCRKKYPMVFRLESGNVEVTDMIGHERVEFDPAEIDDYSFLKEELDLDNQTVSLVPEAIRLLYPELEQ